MYLRHFALTHFPFHDALHTDELFASSAIAEAQARLHHLLELKGIGLPTGEVGSGKTTVCRKVTAGLHHLLYVTLSTGNVMDMYKSIAWELGLPAERNRAGASRAIRDEVTRLVREAKQQPVLVVDEAHHLRNDVLEDLGLLTANYHMDAENRLCVVLIGLTELRRRLSMTVHESLDQRIVVRHHLTGLARDELPRYLEHRLHLAGTELALFSAPATEALFQASNGMPRKVNRMTHYALTAAALDNAQQVTTSICSAPSRSCGYDRPGTDDARYRRRAPRRLARGARRCRGGRAARVLPRSRPRPRGALRRTAHPTRAVPRRAPMLAVG